MERVADYFEGVAWKYLSAVDADPGRSNQHELGGLVKAGFMEYLGGPGRETKQLPARFLYLAEDEAESLTFEGQVSWYDTRRHSPVRGPEYRLYYTSNPVTEALRAGTFLVIAKSVNQELFLIFAEPGSSAERQLYWLFDLTNGTAALRATAVARDTEKTSWAATWILEQLGVELPSGDKSMLDMLLNRFNGNFPSTQHFSQFARDLVDGGDPLNSPDKTLQQFIDQEELLFRTLERHLVQRRLDEGFDDVEDFISYSLSVQNRRKSRAGYALENHLDYIFSSNHLVFQRGAETENRSKPDFLFPGKLEYRDPGFPEGLLSMLGVKSTCKDRWRQVLAEAKRIPNKHLATLEPGISRYQLAEMRAHKLQLVVPCALHDTYDPKEADTLMSLADFIEHVKAQGHCAR